MDRSKGFSLIEVLLSLMLTTTIVFFLLELYGTSFIFFNQALSEIHAANIMDLVEESLILEEKYPSNIDSRYAVHLIQNSEQLKLELYGNKQSPLLTRRYSKIKTVL